MQTITVIFRLGPAIFVTLSLALASGNCSAGWGETLSVSSSISVATSSFGSRDVEKESFDGPADEKGRYQYIVRIDELSLVDEQIQRGTRSPGERYLNDDPGTLLYREQLAARIDDYLDIISRQLGRPIVVQHRFLVANVGFSIWLYQSEAELISQLPGITEVIRNQYFPLDSYSSPGFVGADFIWEGIGVPDGSSGARGEDMVIAVLDSGINPGHPVFRNDASCGHGLEGKPDKLISYVDCTSTDRGGICTGDDPTDSDGHGTFVASIALATVTENHGYPHPQPIAAISGVSPCSHLRSYRVCTDQVSCDLASIESAVMQLIENADIDVLNISIRGGLSPWISIDSNSVLFEAFEHQDILIVSTAGNRSYEGSPVGEVGNLGPWILTAAASTHDQIGMQADVLAGFSSRGPTPQPYQNIAKPDIAAPGVTIFAASVGGRLVTNASCRPPCLLQDIRMTKENRSVVGDELSNVPVRYSESNAYGCREFPVDYFKGAVAIMKLGHCQLSGKIDNASSAGALMIAIVSESDYPAPTLSAQYQSSIPIYAMDKETGSELISAIVGTDSVSGSFTPKVEHYEYKSGTSFAAPHVAGAAVLLRQLHPDWTAAEVKSAIMMTSSPFGTKEDGVTPWDHDDVGSGRLDVRLTGLSGLVMDETAANFLASNPAAGGDPRTLNLPSIRDMDCTPGCTFQRTVRNTLDVPAEWEVVASEITEGFTVEVAPESFSFGGSTHETQELEITLRPLTDLLDEVAFGEIVFNEVGGLSPVQRMTVSLQGKQAEFGGFLFAYDGIQNVSDPFFVLEPRGAGILQPWVYDLDDVYPNNLDGLIFIRPEESFASFYPDGLEVGNIDWQGLGIGKIITWDANGSRYNQTPSGETLYFRGRAICDVLSGMGKIAGAAIREVSEGSYRLGAITYVQAENALHYMERNWHPDIVYSNDDPYDKDENPNGWSVVHSAAHHSEQGLNFRLRSGVHFSDSADKAAGLLRSSWKDADELPWGEVHFDLSSGFSFEYYQIAMFRYHEDKSMSMECEIGNLDLSVECNDSTSDNSSSFKARFDEDDVFFDSSVSEPAGPDYSWAALTDRVTIAIDYNSSSISKLEIAHAEFYATGWSYAAISSGEYAGNASRSCDEDDELINHSWSATGNNSLSGAVEFTRYVRSAYFLDGDEVYDRYSYKRVDLRDVSGSGGGTANTEVNCNPPGKNCKTVTSNSYSYDAAGAFWLESSWPESRLLFADLRDGIVVFSRCDRESTSDRYPVSLGGFGSISGAHVSTEGWRDVLVRDGTVSELYSFSTESIQSIEVEHSHPGMQVGGVQSLMGFSSPDPVFPFSLLCENSVDEWDFSDIVPIHEWIPCSWSGIEFVHYAKYGSSFAYIVRTQPRSNDPQTPVLVFNVNGKTYGQIFHGPIDLDAGINMLSVF